MSLTCGLIVFSALELKASVQDSPIKINEQPEIRTQLHKIKEDFVLLQFWSPFCAPCGQEVQELNALLKSINHEEKRLFILGIPIQSRKKEIEAFVSHFQPQYEQWIPSKDASKTLSGEIKSVPQIFLFNRERNLVGSWSGKVAIGNILTAINRSKFLKKEGALN